MSRLTPGAALVVLAVGCADCEPYLLRAAYEEARILLRREPISQVLAEGDLDPETREKLLLVLAGRRFARDSLGFEVGESYVTFARVEGDAVAHVVTAAYRDRLESYTWRYPIVGRVPYRGFFNLERADGYAAQLEASGLDTAVWPSVAFSTLGWFADPLLSSMLESDAVELLTVMFHELTHAEIYLPSAAEFNESLANFAGHRAAILFFCEAEDPHAERQGTIGEFGEAHKAERCELARTRWRDELSYASALTYAANALRVLYAAGLEPDARSRRRAEILSAATRSMADPGRNWGRYGGVDFSLFNNAVLLQQLLYRRELDLFEAVWRSQEESLGQAIRRIAEVARSGDDFFATLAQLRDREFPGSPSRP